MAMLILWNVALGQNNQQNITDDSAQTILPVCGTTAEFIQSFQTQGGTGTLQPASTFYIPINCGNYFTLYFEDEDYYYPPNGGTPVKIGFFDPTIISGNYTVGDQRRDVFCAVISKLEQQINFGANGVSPTNRIKIYVRQSFDVNNTVPVYSFGMISTVTRWLGRGIPIIAANEPTPVKGNVYKYYQTGVNPSTDPQYPYDAIVQINFDKYYYFTTTPNTGWHYFNIHYFEKVSDTLFYGDCTFDLFSVIYHQMTHALGWVSMLQFTNPGCNQYISNPNPNINNPLKNFPATANTRYSAIDMSIKVGNLSSISNETNLVPLIAGGSVSIPNANDNYWLNANQPPNNLPVLSGIQLHDQWCPNFPLDQFISHLEDLKGSYSKRQRISPGEYQKFVLDPFSKKGVLRRDYTKGEILGIRDILGYQLTSNALASYVVANHPPYCKSMGTNAYSDVYTSWVNPYHDIAEELPVNANLINNGSSITITINSTANYTATITNSNLQNPATDIILYDGDNENMYAEPSTITNFRGCGNGGNNHQQLSYTTINVNGNQLVKTFTYTPRPDFYGRAQFGFALHDGKERGGFVIYTINVTKNLTTVYPQGTNLMVNGNFEEGSEVRTLNATSIYNTSRDQSEHMDGKLIGTHFSDAQLYNWMPNSDQFGGSGCIIKNSFEMCSIQDKLFKYGHWWNGTSTNSNQLSQPNTNTATPLISGGERYLRLRYGKQSTTGTTYSATMLYLKTNIKKCHHYKLRFLARRESDSTTSMNISMVYGFTNDSKLAAYCVPTNGMTQGGLNQISNANLATLFTQHNFSTPLSLDLNSYWQEFTADVYPGNNNVVTNPDLNFAYCSNEDANILYLRKEGTDEGVLIDNIELIDDPSFPLPTATITASTIVPCQSYQLNVNINGSFSNSCGGSGNLSYTWTSAGSLSGLNSTSIPNPILSNTNNGPQTFTCTITNGCITITADIKIGIYPIPTVTVTQNNNCNFTTLTVSPTNPCYQYTWTNNGQIIAVTTSNIFTLQYPASGTYTVTVSPIVGSPCFGDAACSGSANVNVALFSPTYCCAQPQAPPGSIFIDLTYNANVDALINAVNQFGSYGVLSGSSGTLSGFPGYIIFNGNFNVNKNLTIQNCPNLVFGPYATMTLGINKQLNATNSEFRACDTMWTGIIADKANCSVNLNQCNLFDMIDGVHSISGANIVAQSCNFSNN